MCDDLVVGVKAERRPWEGFLLSGGFLAGVFECWCDPNDWTSTMSGNDSVMVM